MYEQTGKILLDKGYQQYEISNFAYPEKECIHNIGYWYRREYRGFGLGAASFIGAERFRNTRQIKDYLTITEPGADLLSIQRDKEILTKQDQMEETMFLGLRCRKGISSSEFFAKFGVEMETYYGSVIKKYCKQELLEWKGDRLRLTEKALLISNVIMQDFL